MKKSVYNCYKQTKLSIKYMYDAKTITHHITLVPIQRFVQHVLNYKVNIKHTWNDIPTCRIYAKGFNSQNSYKWNIIPLLCGFLVSMTVQSMHAAVRIKHFHISVIKDFVNQYPRARSESGLEHRCDDLNNCTSKTI